MCVCRGKIPLLDCLFLRAKKEASFSHGARLSGHSHTHTHTLGQKAFIYTHTQAESLCFLTKCAPPEFPALSFSVHRNMCVSRQKMFFFPFQQSLPLKLFIIRPKSLPSPQDSTDKPERVNTGKEENCVCVFSHVCGYKQTLCTFPDLADFVQAEKYTCFSQNMQKHSSRSLSLSLSLTHTHTHTRTCTHTRPPCRRASEYMAPTPSLRPPHLRSNAVSQFAEDSVCSCGQEMPPFSFPLSLPHPLLEPAPLRRPRNTER